MLAIVVVFGLAVVQVFGSSAPETCPSFSSWWFGNTTCATLPQRNWSYRVISYDPFEYKLHTIFHFGNVPLDCLQVDFRCLLNQTQPEVDYQLGTLWFRCTGKDGFEHRVLVTESIVHSSVIYIPKATCTPAMQIWSTVYVNVLEKKHVLLSTCRNQNLGEPPLYHSAHLLLSSGPIEDDERILRVARSQFNMTFNYWRAKESVAGSCNCGEYKEFLQAVYQKDCTLENVWKRRMFGKQNRGNCAVVVFPRLLVLVLILNYFLLE